MIFWGDYSYSIFQELIFVSTLTTKTRHGYQKATDRSQHKIQKGFFIVDSQSNPNSKKRSDYHIQNQLTHTSHDEKTLNLCTSCTMPVLLTFNSDFTSNFIRLNFPLLKWCDSKLIELKIILHLKHVFVQRLVDFLATLQRANARIQFYYIQGRGKV